ncbi:MULTISPECIES: hypothetical protein [Pseudofrankia]|uniref:hypothetical protein n=1 Tax=Pseudofrankia TaxID=2994363 RepID=UPI000234B77B|nr:MULTISPECIES: hypothetical protein [Pseudofrankia]
MRARGASAYDIARSRFNDYGSLLRLGRLDDADALLADCQRVFTDTGDLDMVGKTFSARAALANSYGRPDEATRLEYTALRLSYIRPDPNAIAISHHNLANYLDPTTTGLVLAHRIAATLLYHLTGITSTWQANTAQALSHHLTGGPDLDIPDTVAAVDTLVSQVDGVRWAGLVDSLAGNRATADQALHDLINAARALPPEPVSGPDPDRRLAAWEPIISAVATAANARQPLPTEVDQVLDELAKANDWANLVAALRRVLAGDRDRDTLAAHLDDVDTAILAAVLDRLS